MSSPPAAPTSPVAEAALQHHRGRRLQLAGGRLRQRRHARPAGFAAAASARPGPGRRIPCRRPSRRASSRSSTASPSDSSCGSVAALGSAVQRVAARTRSLLLVQPEQIGDGARPPPQRLDEVVLQLRHRLVARRRILRERAHDDAIQILRHLKPQRSRPDHLAVPLLGRLPGHHLVEQRADRIDVAAVIDDAAGGLLGRHVLRRPHRDARVGEARSCARRCARRRSRAP